MGKIMRITCAACKEEWQCMTGYGLSHARLQDVIREFSQRVAADITKEAGGEKFPLFEFAYHISTCDDCGSLMSVPVLQMTDINTEYIDVCPVCGHEVKLVTYIGDAACPVCGERALTAREVGHWD